MPEIGKIIKEYRDKSGITMQRLGEEIGIKVGQRQRVSQWESGVRIPSAEYLLKIMSVLHIPPEAFDEQRNGKK